MKLVLLKKLKQSQQLKENVAVLPPSIPPSALPPTGLPSGLSITPTTVRVSSTKNQQPQAAHTRQLNSHKPGQGPIPPLVRGVSCFLALCVYINLQLQLKQHFIWHLDFKYKILDLKLKLKFNFRFKSEILDLDAKFWNASWHFLWHLVLKYKVSSLNPKFWIQSWKFLWHLDFRYKISDLKLKFQV